MTASVDKIPPVFDGHNDLLSLLYRKGMEPEQTIEIADFKTGLDGHLDHEKIKAGGFGGGFFAIWVPSPIDRRKRKKQMQRASYNLPLPAEIKQNDAINSTLGQAAILHKLQKDNLLEICTNISSIHNCFRNDQIAAVMHLEGAEAIDQDFYNLEILYEVGLRSLGPVWSRSNRFGHGVPFRYPSSGDIGPGLSEDGVRLIQYCNNKGILIDVSHLNEAGFWDVAKHSCKPLVATHSNAYSISPHSRNLNDRQLAAIAETKGIVGVNFAVAFLRPDGQANENTSLEIILQHLDHLIEHLGEDGVAFGSDFDGTTVPKDIKDASGLAKLRQAMSEHGYKQDLIEKICNKNWFRVLELIW